MQLLTPDELAQLLRISPRTLKRMRASGQLPPAIHIGKQLRWRAEDIQQWLRTQANRPRKA